MLSFTLDTNCILALDDVRTDSASSRKTEADFVWLLAAAHSAGKARVAPRLHQFPPLRWLFFIAQALSQSTLPADRRDPEIHSYYRAAAKPTPPAWRKARHQVDRH